MKHIIQHHTSGHVVAVRLSRDPFRLSPNVDDAFLYDDHDDAERERALLLSFAPAWESKPAGSAA